MGAVGGRNFGFPIDLANRLYNSLLLSHKSWWLHSHTRQPMSSGNALFAHLPVHQKLHRFSLVQFSYIALYTLLVKNDGLLIIAWLECADFFLSSLITLQWWWSQLALIIHLMHRASPWPSSWLLIWISAVVDNFCYFFYVVYIAYIVMQSSLSIVKAVFSSELSLIFRYFKLCMFTLCSSEWSSWCQCDGCVVLNSVKGPELLNMYVGQSEENVREGL